MYCIGEPFVCRYACPCTWQLRMATATSGSTLRHLALALLSYFCNTRKFYYTVHLSGASEQPVFICNPVVSPQTPPRGWTNQTQTFRVSSVHMAERCPIYSYFKKLKYKKLLLVKLLGNTGLSPFEQAELESAEVDWLLRVIRIHGTVSLLRNCFKKTQFLNTSIYQNQITKSSNSKWTSAFWTWSQLKNYQVNILAFF